MSLEILPSSFLILGIGTEIGKTFLVENLCKKIPNSRAIKPVITGFDPKNFSISDSAKILSSMRVKVSLENIAEISPWRFSQPVAPCFAGKIDFFEVVKFCQNQIRIAKKSNCHFFIESAGGVMTPITYEHSFIDLAIALEIPVLLVAANYLGAISHTLTAVLALESKNIKISKILVNHHFGMVVKPKLLKQLLHDKTGLDVFDFDDLFTEKTKIS